MNVCLHYDKNGSMMEVIRLNKVIHQPLTDIERIKRAGGAILGNRIQGEKSSLAVSRALGDYRYIPYGVCDDAHTDVISIKQLIAELQYNPEHIGKMQLITTCDGSSNLVEMKMR